MQSAQFEHGPNLDRAVFGGGHAFSDQDTGRIYRVTPIGAKAKADKPDFGTVRGLIAALKSPVVAAQDAARRGLIEYAKAGNPNAKPVDPWGNMRGGDNSSSGAKAKSKKTN